MKSSTYWVRFWVEATAALTSSVLLLTTLFWPNWIEFVFRVDPDHGNGTLEWAITSLLLFTTLTSAMLARRHYRLAAEPSH